MAYLSTGRVESLVSKDLICVEEMFKVLCSDKLLKLGRGNIAIRAKR